MTTPVPASIASWRWSQRRWPITPSPPLLSRTSSPTHSPTMVEVDLDPSESPVSTHLPTRPLPPARGRCWSLALPRRGLPSLRLGSSRPSPPRALCHPPRPHRWWEDPPPPSFSNVLRESGVPISEQSPSPSLMLLRHPVAAASQSTVAPVPLKDFHPRSSSYFGPGAWLPLPGDPSPPLSFASQWAGAPAGDGVGRRQATYFLAVASASPLSGRSTTANCPLEAPHLRRCRVGSLILILCRLLRAV